MQLATILGSKGSAVLTIHPEASVAGLVAMLAEHSVGALVVSPDGAIISGIVSERDVVRSLMHGSAVLDAPVASIMTPQVYCAPPTASIDEIMHLMTERRIRHVPITDDTGTVDDHGTDSTVDDDDGDRTTSSTSSRAGTSVRSLPAPFTTTYDSAGARSSPAPP